MKRTLVLLLSILLLILSLSNCRVNEENENPVPVLTKISPAFKVTNMLSFVLTANGRGLYSVCVWS